ncbi:uncharacterized protein [Dermacentor albipictus]|uniref:uncharacterized protein isoform X2 n=1 Tax=Dermacentor albipictus TaxID=60249 RepID=UPI0031FD5B0B
MGKGCSGNGYLQTKRAMATMATTAISLVLLLLLNIEGYFYGAYQMLHYLSFSYLLNGGLFILHGLMGDMEPTKKYLVTYYGSGALMFLVSGFITLSYRHDSTATMAIMILAIIQGVLMAVLAIFVKML